MHEIKIAMFAALAALVLQGCKPGPGADGFYNIPPEAAYDKLLDADIKGFRNARQCGMLIYFVTNSDPRRSITWTVTSNYVRVARFAVRIAPKDKGSIISIDVPKGPNGEEMYNGKQRYTHPAIMQPLRPAVRELIDAAIAGRPFDWKKIPDPLNTDGLCGSLRNNFEASGRPYVIDDPSGMTHEQAQEMRQRGIYLPAERDKYFAEE